MTTSDDDAWVIVQCAAIALAVAAALGGTPYVAAWLHDGTWLELSLSDAILETATVLLTQRWDDPAGAYPADAAAVLPGTAGWWTALAMTFAGVGGLTIGVWRRLDVRMAIAVAGRRPYDLRGSRPRSWARPRDLRDAVVSTRRPDRFTLGRLDGRLVASDPEAHVAVVAPTRSGKTTRCVIPWLLEHDGPAIVTSTKLDLVEATESWRSRRGTVWVWDPFSPGSAWWTPLHGCESWSHAIAQAHWIADASQEGDSEIAAYWRGEAAKLLAPLLHAAALDGRTMPEILGWIDAQDVKAPGRILKDAGREDAYRQIKAVVDLDPRNRGTTYMSAGSLLAAFRYPQLDDCSGLEVTADRFFDGGANTLYVVAGARHQRLLVPLVVGLLSAFLHEAAERARIDGPLRPALRVLLDEVANIAPLRDLPAHLSQAAGHGLRIATIWQSLAQLDERYGRAGESILANSTVKLFMGPITDERTRKYLQGLLGERRAEARASNRSPGRNKAGQGPMPRPTVEADELQQLATDRAIVLSGAQKPVVLGLSPWWAQRDLRARGA